MKGWTLSAALALTVFGFGAAQADDINPNLNPYQGYYISGYAGGSFLPDLHFRDTASGLQHEHFDDGFAAGGALGYDMGDGWRVELDSLYQHSSLKGLGGASAVGHLSSTSVMGNATYDLFHGTSFTPYLGAGLGFQNIGGDVNGFSGRQWRPAYQLEGGLRTRLSDKASLFGEYRFSQSEAGRLHDSTADIAHQHFADHALLAGLSYNLN